MNNLQPIWQSPQVVGAIVGSLLTAVLGTLAFLWRSRRGNRVIVARHSQSPQINVSRRVKRLLRILYNDQPVTSLVLNILRIHNAGTDVIRDIQLTLHIREVDSPSRSATSERFVDVEVEDPISGRKLASEISVRPLEQSEGKRRWEIHLAFPYINPKQRYGEDQLEIAVFSANELEMSASGGGEGWFAKYKDVRGRKNLDATTAIVFVAAALIFLGAAMTVGLVGEEYFQRGTILGNLMIGVVTVSFVAMLLSLLIGLPLGLVNFIRGSIASRRKPGHRQ